MIKVLVPLLAFTLAHCELAPLPKQSDCDLACERMRDLSCPESEPDSEGQTCEQVCENAQKSGIIDLNPSCRAKQQSCEAMEENCQ